MKIRALGIILLTICVVMTSNGSIALVQAQDEEDCFEILDDYMLEYLDFTDLDEMFEYLDSLDEAEIDKLLEESGGFDLLDACENGELDNFNPSKNDDNSDTGSAPDDLNIPEFTGVLEIQPNPNADHPALGVFSKYINVFGVSIYATTDVPDAKVLHAANVMAEYLDNDEDGEPDNAWVVNALAENNAQLIMFNTEGSNAEEEFVDNLADDAFASTQPLYGFETHPEGSQGEAFDATLEEVLHLITHVGYATVYPDVFGEEAGSEIAEAMDSARGGHFENIPSNYPADAWYTYDDETCEYDCQVTEYFYWSLTTLLGAQKYP